MKSSQPDDQFVLQPGAKIVSVHTVYYLLAFRMAIGARKIRRQFGEDLVINTFATDSKPIAT